MATPLALPPAGRTRPRNLLNISVMMVVTGGVGLFAALIAAYVAVSNVAQSWPPAGVHFDDYVGNMLALTAVMSGVTVEWAWYSVRRDDRAQTTWGLLLTALFGLATLNLVFFLGRSIGFGPGNAKVGPFAVVFFALLSAAGAVGILGIIAVVMAMARTIGGQMTPVNNEMVRAVCWLWDFVVISWIAVYATLFVFT
jgi:heme/copper-type cytochrome/quinol oxidase subunit 3